MKKGGKIYIIKKYVTSFYKENKMLSCLSLSAVGFILFYYFSYNLPEIWTNASVLVDILFQLSLAITANLIFFVFQVYIPSLKRINIVRPIILRKFKFICQKMDFHFLDITEKYLEQQKHLDELSDADIQEILEKYCPNDKSNIQMAFECRKLTYSECFNFCFDEIDHTIKELLLEYDSYLNAMEQEILLLIKDNDLVYKLFADPIFKLFDTKGIKGDSANYVLKDYIDKYEKILKIIGNQ